MERTEQNIYRNCRSYGDPVGFLRLPVTAIMTAVDAYTSALLPQTDVLRMRELLVMLDNIEKGLVTTEALNNRAAIQRVLNLIDAMPPVAVIINMAAEIGQEKEK